MYAPKKVFVIEQGGFIELTYEEFCRRKETDPTYAEKLFIPLYGMLMEVSEADYEDFYRKKRRQEYIDERSRSHKDISYDMLTTDMFNGEDILVDHGTDVAVQTEHKILLDKLRAVLPLLTDKEQRLIRALYFEGMTERQYAEQEGVYRNAIHKRKVRILAKLKKLLEK